MDLVPGEPPGTIHFELVHRGGRKEVELHPQPSNDPNDPLNWSIWNKAINYGLVCFFVLMVFVNLDVGPVIWANLLEDLDISFESAQISFGVNTAGLAVGCVLFIPFAIRYGRRSVYLISILISLASSIWQAEMMTTGDLIGANLISGLAGATSETICQMTIADMFFLHQRGAANAVYLFLQLAGTFLGPVAAGYSAASQGWRWIRWWCVILLGICFLLFLFLYEDTKYTPVTTGLPSTSSSEVPVHDGKDAGMDTPKQTIQLHVTSSHTISNPPRRKSYLERMRFVTPANESWSTFLRHIYEPFVLITMFPAISFTALTFGSLLAWFSVVVNLYSTYFTLPPYNFSSIGVGLMNLPPFIGVVIGSILSGIVTDRSIIWLARRNNGVFEPEMRLWSALPIIILLPGSVLMFGLPTAYGTHWIVPAVGLGIFGFSFAVLGDVALTYAMDCYTIVVGDAFTGIVFTRNVAATIIATTLTSWIDGVGLINVIVTSTVLAFALTALLIPMLIWGKRMRRLTAARYLKMAARFADVRR